MKDIMPNPAERRIVAVSELTAYIKSLLERDGNLRNLWVRGEISNFKHHSSGHMYFTLKDESGTIRVVMFRSRASLLKFRPENGMRVLVRGSLSVYARDGNYQLYGEDMEPDGLGSLHLAFEQLKARLEQEGLFETWRKRKLPPIPRRVGLITSPTGAAVQDMLNIMGRRFPGTHIVIVPVAVQGEEAPGQIARGIQQLNEYSLEQIAAGGSGVDVLIVGRGGGSLEELWAFNTELVARAIFQSAIPVVSAVGHETDFSIADFVADLRAPTPSAAAELVVPETSEVLQRLDGWEIRLAQGLRHQLQLRQRRLELCLNNRVFTRPADRVYQLSQLVDNLERQLINSSRRILQQSKGRLGELAGRLQVLSPLSTLSRGYSLTIDTETRKVVRGVADVVRGQKLSTLLADGQLECIVEEIKDGKEKNRG